MPHGLRATYDRAFLDVQEDILRLGKMVDEAIEQWQLAVLLAPKSGKIYNNLAIACHGLGDYDLAWYYVRMAGKHRYVLKEDFIQRLRRDSGRF